MAINFSAHPNYNQAPLENCSNEPSKLDSPEHHPQSKAVASEEGGALYSRMVKSVPHQEGLREACELTVDVFNFFEKTAQESSPTGKEALEENLSEVTEHTLLEAQRLLPPSTGKLLAIAGNQTLALAFANSYRLFQSLAKINTVIVECESNINGINAKLVSCPNDPLLKLELNNEKVKLQTHQNEYAEMKKDGREIFLNNLLRATGHDLARTSTVLSALSLVPSSAVSTTALVGSVLGTAAIGLTAGLEIMNLADQSRERGANHTEFDSLLSFRDSLPPEAALLRNLLTIRLQALTSQYGDGLSKTISSSLRLTCSSLALASIPAGVVAPPVGVALSAGVAVLFGSVILLELAQAGYKNIDVISAKTKKTVFSVNKKMEQSSLASLQSVYRGAANQKGHAEAMNKAVNAPEISRKKRDIVNLETILENCTKTRDELKAQLRGANSKPQKGMDLTKEIAVLEKNISAKQREKFDFATKLAAGGKAPDAKGIQRLGQMAETIFEMKQQLGLLHKVRTNETRHKDAVTNLKNARLELERSNQATHLQEKRVKTAAAKMSDLSPRIKKQADKVKAAARGQSAYTAEMEDARNAVMLGMSSDVYADFKQEWSHHLSDEANRLLLRSFLMSHYQMEMTAFEENPFRVMVNFLGAPPAEVPSRS